MSEKPPSLPFRAFFLVEGSGIPILSASSNTIPTAAENAGERKPTSRPGKAAGAPILTGTPNTDRAQSSI